jgi:Type I phosphodiesterase / nucleotide pyrophosphatase
MHELGPERVAGQGLDPNQYESADRAILALLHEPPARDQVDLVTTWRDGAYEAWSRRGMIRFKRYRDDNGSLVFKVIDQIGENPVENQDPFAVATIEEELSAAELSGNPTADPNACFFEPHVLSHPHAYERIAQVFDSPRGPDLVVSPKCYAYGIQPGQHGALDVVQSRAPLFFTGPGVRPGRYQIAACHVDIAPTIAHFAGFPQIEGLDGCGRPASVYLKRQDGHPLDDVVNAGARPERVYLILLDGLSNSELIFHLTTNPGAIPNLAWLASRSAFLTRGSTVNYPSITWPSHSAILSGAWSGHHDVVNPTFYIREKREVVPAQGNIFDTERYLSPDVETLYEAFKRVHGPDAITASIHEPQGRGADHAVFERRIVGDKARLKEITAAMISDVSPRWVNDNKHAMQREEIVDIRGLAQTLNLFEHCDSRRRPPVFVAHEFVMTDGAGHDYGPHHDGLREALYRTDRRIGVVLEMLRKRGLIDSTLFVVTSDHGMAAQRIELKANPAAEPSRFGIKAVYAEPMIYLRDLAVECSRARDGRTLRVAVFDNDADASGEHTPVEGASVAVYSGERKLGEARTEGSGTAAFSTPANLSDGELRVEVAHENYNSRNLRADGHAILPDIRKVLYGS